MVLGLYPVIKQTCALVSKYRTVDQSAGTFGVLFWVICVILCVVINR